MARRATSRRSRGPAFDSSTWDPPADKRANPAVTWFGNLLLNAVLVALAVISAIAASLFYGEPAGWVVLVAEGVVAIAIARGAKRKRNRKA
jgi:hypothetical protein